MNLTERIKSDKYALFYAIVCALLLILIVYSIYVRVRMYMLGTSLWDIEARLVESVVNKSMGAMLTPPLVNRQTAPALYLIVVKLLTMLFGTSEAVLRSFSFAALIGMLFAQWALMRKVFQVRIVYTLFSIALSSTFLFYMQASAEFKSYMGDAVFILVTLLGYYFYREGKLGAGFRGAVFLALILIVCMLFSTPAAFAAGAVIIVEFLSCCLRRNRKAILLIVVCGVIFLVAFLLNYYSWLKPIANSGGMVEYWRDRKIFWTLSGDAMLHNYWVLHDLLIPVWNVAAILLPFSAIGLLISLVRKNIYTVCVCVFFVLLIIANAIDKYPLQDRLWTFLFVLLFIYTFIFLDALRLSVKNGRAYRIVQTVIPLCFALVLLAPNMSFPAYGKGAESTLIPGNQANPLIAYVKDNIRDGEFLYSYSSATLVLKYKNGYDTDRIGNVSADNIIYGTNSVNDDVDKIVATGDAYVLFSHAYYPLSNDRNPINMTQQLQEKGFMEQIMDVNYTPLYWFTNDIAKTRTSVSINMSDFKEENGGFTGVLHISNTGQSILAPEVPFDPPSDITFNADYSKVSIVISMDGKETVLGEVTAPVPPGGSTDIQLNQDGLKPGEYKLELKLFDKYTSADFGADPVYFTLAG